MPKIQNASTPVIRTPKQAPVATPKKPAAEPAKVNGGWAAKTGAVSAPKAQKYPEVATAAKNFVDAYAVANKATNQMAMVEGSVGCANAGDALLKRATEELASQLSDRGQDKAAAKVTKDMDAFFKKIGPPKHYRLDPERGTMASLEDNGERMTKVLAQMAKVSAELGKVNKEPAGEYQQAYNRSAGGDEVKAEVDFALKFQKAYNEGGDDAVIKKAQTFFKALPKNVDSQVESRGGSLEPLERAGGAATALNDFAKTL